VGYPFSKLICHMAMAATEEHTLGHNLRGREANVCYIVSLYWSFLTPLAHCIRQRTDPIDSEWGGAPMQCGSIRSVGSVKKVENCSTFQAATDQSSNQITYARAWLTDASAKTTLPSVSHACRHPLTDGAVGGRRWSLLGLILLLAWRWRSWGASALLAPLLS
jgi:hypothetical protein